MKRILAFLVLAGGGLLALAAATGGFHGTSRERPKPELTTSEDEAPGAASRPTGVRVTEIPLGRGQLPPASVEPLESLDVHENQPRTWVDPVTKEKIELPYFPELSIHFTDPTPFSDEASGDVGARWRKAEVLMYRDVTSLSREEALALRATMVAAGDGRTPRASSEEDSATRARFVRFVITAEEGEASLRTIPFAGRDRVPEVRKVVKLSKNVVIRDLLQNAVLNASDLVIDHGAGTAEGTGPIEVESPAYRMRGRGFRLDRKAARLVILEQTVVDARQVASEVTAGPVDFASGTFRPRMLRAGGPVTVRRLADEHGEPWHEVALSGGVHVELDGNRTLDARAVTLRIVRASPSRRTSAQPAGAATRGDAGLPGGEAGDRWRLSRMTADGDVLVESPDAAAAPTSLLSAWGPRMVSDFASGGLGSTRLEGRCGVSWRGRLALPGEAAAFRVVTATCEEVLRFGPRDPAETSLPPCDAVLDLVGSARVEGGEGGSDPDPQRIDADRLRVCLRKKAPSAKRPAGTDPTPGRRDAVGAGLVAIAFSATGEARLSGPRVRGRAREIHGFDLDRDDFRVVASGQGTLLEIVEKDAPARTSPAAAPDDVVARRSARTWILERMSAVGGVNGSSAAIGGADPLRFTGDRFDFEGTTGGILRGREESHASVVLPGSGGRDDVLEALVISFGGTDAERTLHAEGGARIDLAVGDRGPGAPRAAARGGTRIVALRSGSRIEAVGSRGAAGSRDARVTVTLSDGGSLEARTGETTTDRIAGERIELVLAERVPAPGETSFGAFGSRARDDLPGGAPPGDAAPTTARPRDAGKGGAAGLGDGRWTLRADRMDVVAASTGRDLEALKRLVAVGNVDVRNQGGRSAARFEGGRLELEGASGHGVLIGREGARAKVTLGEGPAPQRLTSPRIDFDVVGGDLAQATFAAPVSGIVNGAPGKDGRVDRYGIVSEAGPLTIERGAPGAGMTIVLIGTDAVPVLVGRTTRDAKGALVGRPVRLSTPKLTLITSKPLGASAMELERLTAEGPATRVDLGEDAPDATHAVGDLLVYERAASRMTLSAKDRVVVVSPTMNGRARRFMLDPATGLWDVEGAERIRAEVPR